MKKRVSAILLCLVVGLGLASCTGEEEQTRFSPSPDASPGESVSPDAVPSDDAHETDVEEVRLAVLSGPAGVGAAKLLSANESRACRNYYDVTIAADNSEISAKLINGELDIAAVDPGAAASLYHQTGGGVQLLCLSAPDLTEEWNGVTVDSVLTVGSVVARTEFVQEHPDKVAAFLEDYQESVTYVNNNVEEASALVERLGIAPSAAAAGPAIPDCGLVYITGEEMRGRIQDYYEVLYAADHDSIGGGIPDDAFYYGVE